MEAVFKDIGTGGARVAVHHPPAVAPPIALDVRLSHFDGNIPALRAEGFATRAPVGPRREFSGQLGPLGLSATRRKMRLELRISKRTKWGGRAIRAR